MKKLNNKTVVGEGFTISVPDIHRVVYSCGSHVAEIEIEGGGTAGQVDWVVYASTLKARDESDCEFVKTEREEILVRINEALTLLSMPHSME